MACTMSRLVAAIRRTLTRSSCVPPTRYERAVLKKPQQFGLKRFAHVSDLIEENRAAVRVLHAALISAESRR